MFPHNLDDFDAANNATSLKGDSGRRFHIDRPHEFCGRLVFIARHSFRGVDGDASAPVQSMIAGLPASIFDVLACMDDCPSPRLANRESKKRKVTHPVTAAFKSFAPIGRTICSA